MCLSIFGVFFVQTGRAHKVYEASMMHAKTRFYPLLAPRVAQKHFNVGRLPLGSMICDM